MILFKLFFTTEMLKDNSMYIIFMTFRSFEDDNVLISFLIMLFFKEFTCILCNIIREISLTSPFGLMLV